MLSRSVISLASVVALHVAVTIALLAGGEWLGQVNFETREAVVIGLTFGQALVAGAWAALGPLRAVVRIPAAVLWTLTTSLAIAGQFGEKSFDKIIVFSGAMLAQMLLVQLPLGMVCYGMCIRLAGPEASNLPPAAKEYQFGIRELLVLTTVVAAVLGFSRWMIDLFDLQASAGVEWRVVVNLSLLVCCNSLLTLPLVLALLLARRSVAAMLIALAFAAGVTLLEQSLFMRMGQISGNPAIFWEVNGLECAWVFTSLLLVWLAGYRLVRQGPVDGAAVEPA